MLRADVDSKTLFKKASQKTWCVRLCVCTYLYRCCNSAARVDLLILGKL